MSSIKEPPPDQQRRACPSKPDLRGVSLSSSLSSTLNAEGGWRAKDVAPQLSFRILAPPLSARRRPRRNNDRANPHIDWKPTVCSFTKWSTYAGKRVRIFLFFPIFKRPMAQHPLPPWAPSPWQALPVHWYLRILASAGNDYRPRFLSSINLFLFFSFFKNSSITMAICTRP